MTWKANYHKPVKVLTCSELLYNAFIIVSILTGLALIAIGYFGG